MIFPTTLIKIEIFENFDQNRDFPKILTKIEIFPKIHTEIEASEYFGLNFDQEIFRKFSPKSRFSKNSNQNRRFPKFSPKSRFSVNFDKNRDLPKFDQNRYFPQIFTKIMIFPQL